MIHRDVSCNEKEDEDDQAYKIDIEEAEKERNYENEDEPHQWWKLLKRCKFGEAYILYKKNKKR